MFAYVRLFLTSRVKFRKTRRSSKRCETWPRTRSSLSTGESSCFDSSLRPTDTSSRGQDFFLESILLLFFIRYKLIVMKGSKTGFFSLSGRTLLCYFILNSTGWRCVSTLAASATKRGSSAVPAPLTLKYANFFFFS